jgi:K+-transporting ATPase A subunit
VIATSQASFVSSTNRRSHAGETGALGIDTPTVAVFQLGVIVTSALLALLPARAPGPLAEGLAS